MRKGIGIAEQFTPILGIGFAEHSQRAGGFVLLFSEYDTISRVSPHA